MPTTVDSYRFISGITKRMIQTWIKKDGLPASLPWTPLRKPLHQSKVALLSSAGAALLTDKPFDQETERRNPWWGDPSYRLIPRQVQTGDVDYYHLHINADYARKDINCLFPIQRLNELEATGEIGKAADWHYSMMGYLLDPTELLERSVPAMIEHMRAAEIDVLLLAPA